MTALVFGAVMTALGLAVAWASAAVLYPTFGRLVARWPTLGRLAVLGAALPWLLGAAVAIAALVPGDPHTSQLFGCHCATSGPGWAHLCAAHPATAFGLLPLAILVCAALLPGRVAEWRRLAREPVGAGQGVAVTLVDLPWPTAVLSGWRRPSLLVDPRLWSALSLGERDALLAHEAAHLQRRDPTVLMVLRALCSIGGRRSREPLLRAWLLRAELRADAQAARVLGDPLVVAQALVRCARLAGARPATLALGIGGGALEARIERLLAPPSRVSLGDLPDVDRRDLLLLAVLGAAVLASTPWVHHQLEHLLNLSF